MFGKVGEALERRVHGEQKLAGEEREAAEMCRRGWLSWAIYRPGLEGDENEEKFLKEIGSSGR